jgi:predicted glycoside hydrolase/deacetylase ChbG (UPF0249 family)
MTRLIINADDFGYSEEITLGIAEAIQSGPVTSTSLMVNQDYSQQALQSARQIKDASVGIHFNLDDGRPLCTPQQVPTLVDEQGRFHDGKTFRKRVFSGKISLKEIYRELEAQLAEFLSFGIRPSHIDFHHHLHLCYPVLEVALQMANDFGIKRMRTVRLYRLYAGNGSFFDYSRWRKSAVDFYRSWLHNQIQSRASSPDFLLEPKIFGDNGSSPRGWTQAIESLREGSVFELCCHLKHNQDPQLLRREAYLEIPQEDVFAALLEKENVSLISYWEL